MSNKTISHYWIIDKLGGGGMGVIHEAEDVRRDVAIKFPPEDLAANPAALEHFLDLLGIGPCLFQSHNRSENLIVSVRPSLQDRTIPRGKLCRRVDSS